MFKELHHAIEGLFFALLLGCTIWLFVLATVAHPFGNR